MQASNFCCVYRLTKILFLFCIFVPIYLPHLLSGYVLCGIQFADNFVDSGLLDFIVAFFIKNTNTLFFYLIIGSVSFYFHLCNSVLCLNKCKKK